MDACVLQSDDITLLQSLAVAHVDVSRFDIDVRQGTPSVLLTMIITVEGECNWPLIACSLEFYTQQKFQAHCAAQAQAPVVFY